MVARGVVGITLGLFVGACTSDHPGSKADNDHSGTAKDSGTRANSNSSTENGTRGDAGDTDVNSSTENVEDTRPSSKDPRGDSGAADSTVEPDVYDTDGVVPDVNEADSSEPDVNETESVQPEIDAGMIGDCTPGRSRTCATQGAKGNCTAGKQRCQKDATWGACSVQPQDADDCAIPGDDADCDGIPNSGCACTDGEEQSCGPTQAIGRCVPGVSVCQGGIFQACEGAVNATDRDCSSSKDNDCDGIADNTIDSVCQCEPGTARACEPHPGLDGNGQCKAGTQICKLGPDGSTSTWGECIGSVGPELQDSCDGVDDSNCNGVPNEGCDCTSDAQCDDNAPCTQDSCDNGTCTHTIESGYCHIGECVSHNALDPTNPCRYCDAILNQSDWTNSPAGASCDDGIWCNGSDGCNGSGQCTQHQHTPDRCADQSGPCVLDACDEINRTCFRGSDYICDPGEQQYECTGALNTCGGSDVHAYSVQRHCSGSGGECLGDFETVSISTQDCGTGYCDDSTLTCQQLGCGDTWCNEGLCWTLDDPEGMPLADAEAYCAGLDRDGLTWRLPSVSEWLDIARGCDNTTGAAVDDVNFHSTCTTIPCDNPCPQLGGPNPYGCYWPTELGDCQGIEGDYSSGRYWSGTSGNYYNATGNWAISLSTLESLHTRCVAAGSGP